jgi:DNA-binding beta-propeller fold protein YncE
VPRVLLSLSIAVALGACDDAVPQPQRAQTAARSSAPLALLPDGETAVVVHPDGDTVAFVDLRARRLIAETALGTRPTLRDDGRWEPRIAPGSVAVSAARGVVYVTGRNDGHVYALDVDTHRIVERVEVCAEPVAALVVPSTDVLLVSCAADRWLCVLDGAPLTNRGCAPLTHEAGALALAPDDRDVFVLHANAGALTRVSLSPLRTHDVTALAVAPWRGHPMRANGTPRALTFGAMRPNSQELWVLHTLLATETAAPHLNFETTVFPAITRLDTTTPTLRAMGATISTDSRLADRDGALDHVVSGPRALAFTPDGAYALMLSLNSESLTVIEVQRGVEHRHLQDLPGTLHDALIQHPDGNRAWINARGTGTLVALRVSSAGEVSLDGTPFSTRGSDPMPPTLRRGQWMFYTANDRYQSFPITVNRWLACESCHSDGGSASITQRTAQGPRDIPDLRAGIDGFVHRTATRRGVEDSWLTIRDEMGGQLRPDDDLFGPYLAALTEYVTHALPRLHPPRTDVGLVAAGRRVFERSDVGCARCHQGDRFTDSALGNPALDLRGEVRLHDVGTCVTVGPYVDRTHSDMQGGAREACRFDTPTLRGVARTGPWLHDGSAATLNDVISTRNRDNLHGRTGHLNEHERQALVEFLRSL